VKLLKREKSRLPDRYLYFTLNYGEKSPYLFNNYLVFNLQVSPLGADVTGSQWHKPILHGKD